MENIQVSAFAHFQLIKPLHTAIDGLGWRNPTDIQEKAIPLAKAGRDILGIAQTGTGKTAAYLLPLMHKLHHPQEVGTRAIILVPTKELARQIFQHFDIFNSALHLKAEVLIGGIGLTNQLKGILTGNDLVIATPGRFLDIYQTGEWKLKNVKTLVIDEADRMMDMGFMPQIRKILEVIPNKRQNFLFSATFPPKVDDLAAEFLEFPERIEITPQATPAKTIEQWHYKSPNFQTKLNLLLFHLHQLDEDSSALVFVKTRQHATEIGKFLDRKLPYKVNFLHANKGTNSRSQSVDRLLNGEIKVLVATDIAARGLDIESIGIVINFDLPIQYEDYVHRIGRTGRANRKGIAISFVAPPDELHLSRTENLIKMKIAERPLPEGCLVENTAFEELQEIRKKLDDQKKRADPSFKGAFHEKKSLKSKSSKDSQRPRPKGKSMPKKSGQKRRG